MRTQEELIKRIKERTAADMFGFEVSEYYYALTEESFNALKEGPTPYVRTDAVYSDMPEEVKLLTDSDVHKKCVDYMEFAWEKANNFRGISAMRSIQHYVAWMWMKGDDFLDEAIDDYQYYGKDLLVEICKRLGIEPTWDDGVRLNEEP